MKKNYRILNIIALTIKVFIVGCVLVLPVVAIIDCLFFGLDLRNGYVTTWEAYSNGALSNFMNFMDFIFTKTKILIPLAIINIFITWYSLSLRGVSKFQKITHFLLNILFTIEMYSFALFVINLNLADVSANLIAVLLNSATLMLMGIFDLCWFLKTKEVR
ncbi:MAG: hypothetical protein ACK5KQ_00415 [Anaerorhabdus sp.]